MGIAELAAFEFGLQVSQAACAFLGKISPLPTNVYAKAAVLVGQQFSYNACAAFKLGVKAAAAELATTQAQEAAAATALQGLPPIT